MRTSDLAFVIALASATPLALLCSVTPAHADASELDMANARKLFNEGLDARKVGDQKLALEKFEAADALFATPRGRLELGRQRMTVGQLVEAYTTLLSVANIKVAPKDETKYAPYRTEATELATSLEKKIPTVAITLANVPSGISPTIRVDQAIVPLAAMSEPRMVNPGTHTITGIIDGQPEKTQSVDLKEGESKAVTITFDTPTTTSTTTTTTTSTSVTASTTPSSPPPTPSPAHEASSWSAQKTIAIVTGSVGAVGLLFSTGFAFAAKAKANDAKPDCGGVNSSTTCSSTSAVNERHDAIRLANLSTFTFIAGAAFVTTGVVLWLTAPSKSNDAPKTGLVVGPGALLLQGSF